MDGTPNLKSLFREIEGPDFESTISIESGFERMICRIIGHRAVREMITVARDKNSPRSVDPLLERIRRLASVAVDPRYRSQYDTALTAYLLVLAVSAPRYLSVGVRLVNSAPNTWLAKRTMSMLNKMPGTVAEATEIYQAGRSPQVPAGSLADLNNTTGSHLTEWSEVSGSVIGFTDIANAGGESTTINVDTYLSTLAPITPAIVTGAHNEDVAEAAR